MRFDAARRGAGPLLLPSALLRARPPARLGDGCSRGRRHTRSHDVCVSTLLGAVLAGPLLLLSCFIKGLPARPQAWEMVALEDGGTRVPMTYAFRRC